MDLATLGGFRHDGGSSKTVTCKTVFGVIDAPGTSGMFTGSNGSTVASTAKTLARGTQARAHLLAPRVKLRMVVIVWDGLRS